MFTVSGKMMLEGNGVADTWEPRMRIEMLMQVRAEDKKAMVESMSSLLLLLATLLRVLRAVTAHANSLVWVVNL